MKYQGIIKGLTKLVGKLEAYQQECATNIATAEARIRDITAEKAELATEQSKAAKCAGKLKEIIE